MTPADRVRVQWRRICRSPVPMDAKPAPAMCEGCEWHGRPDEPCVWPSCFKQAIPRGGRHAYARL